MFEKYKEFFGDFDNQKRYAKWIGRHTKPYIFKLLLLTGMNSLSSLISIFMTLLAKQVIDNASNGKSVIKSIVIYAVITLISIGLSAIYSVLNTVIIEKYSFEIRRKVYRGILDTCWSDISRYHSGDIMTRMTSDVNIVASGVAGLISGLIVLLVQLAAAFFTLFHFDRWLAIFTLIIAPITAIIGIWMGKKVRVLQVKVQESEAAYRAFMQESVANQLIIKAFCNQKQSEDKLNKLRNERLKWILKKNKMNVIATSIMGLAYSLVYVVAFAWGAIKLSLNKISYGTMSVFLSLVGQIQTPLVGLANQIPQIVTVLASAGRIIELEELSRDKYIEKKAIPSKINLHIDDLEFGYIENENVIDKASININTGEVVGIVGESGVGKTTLIRLIMNFLNAKSGDITFMDEFGNKEEVNANVREYISYVPQGNTLFSGTIEENIYMGKTDASQEELDEAIRAACMDTFVYDLKDGIRTKLGEKGNGVSEGQAQRIAIARALIRKAPLLILDEATSSLDEKTELSVLKSISRLKQKPTCIIITHRRSALKICNKELIIENGKIKAKMLNIV